MQMQFGLGKASEKIAIGIGDIWEVGC
jgi:hypothetical protein